ncbi:MAG: hypothetical protein Q9223_006992 [Gallowayella weberi]
MAYLNTTAVALSNVMAPADPLANLTRTVPRPTPPRKTKPSLPQRIKKMFTIPRLKKKGKSLPKQWLLQRVREDTPEVLDRNPDSGDSDFIHEDPDFGYEIQRVRNPRLEGNDSYNAEEAFRRGQRVWLRDNPLPPPAYHEIGEAVPEYQPPAATNRRTRIGEYAFLRRFDSPEFSFIDL